MVDVLLETFAAFVETVAVQGNGRRSEMANQIGIFPRGGQQLGRLFQRSLLELKPQFLRALQQRPDGRLQFLGGRMSFSLLL